MSGDPSEAGVVHCANCGAPIKSLAADSLCPYCGSHVHQLTENEQVAQFLVEAVSEAVQQGKAAGGKRSAQAQPLAGADALATFKSAQNAFVSVKKGCSTVVTLIVLIALAILAIPFYAHFTKSKDSFEYWDTSAEVPASIAGHDAFLGLGRSYFTDKLYLAAIDADGARLLWKMGALGTYSQGHQYTHFAIAGNQAAVSDYRGRLHVLELTTGHSLRTVWLPDRADQLCSGGAGSSVWAEVINKQNVAVNLQTGAVTHNAPRPAGCIDEHTLRNRAAGAPRVWGFKADHVLRSGTLAVAAGEKTLGKQGLAAVGFDPATGSIRWRTEIPAVATSGLPPASYPLAKADVIAGDRYVVAYPTGQGTDMRLAAFDVMTGKRLWDRLMPKGHNNPSGLVATPHYILVGRWLALDVFQKSNGQYVGTVGSAR